MDLFFFCSCNCTLWLSSQGTTKPSLTSLTCTVSQRGTHGSSSDSTHLERLPPTQKHWQILLCQIIFTPKDPSILDRQIVRLIPGNTNTLIPFRSKLPIDRFTKPGPERITATSVFPWFASFQICCKPQSSTGGTRTLSDPAVKIVGKYRMRVKDVWRGGLWEWNVAPVRGGGHVTHISEFYVLLLRGRIAA